MSKAIGGVPLNICTPIHDSNTGLNLPAGPVNLEGDQALAFVRARYGLTGGDDLHRIQRQQQFMSSMVRKALSSANFFNPTTMYNFYSAVASSLSTDMTSSQLLSLGINYRHTNTSNIVFVTVPTYPAPKGDPFYQHLYWSEDEANALFADIHDDRAIPVSSGSNVANITLPRSAVSVEVLNGTSTDGLARQVRDQLSAAGFDVVSIGTASNSPVAKTTVAYQASHTTSMQTLVGALSVDAAGSARLERRLEHRADARPRLGWPCHSVTLGKRASERTCVVAGARRLRYPTSRRRTPVTRTAFRAERRQLGLGVLAFP